MSFADQINIATKTDEHLSIGKEANKLETDGDAEKALIKWKEIFKEL